MVTRAELETMTQSDRIELMTAALRESATEAAKLGAAFVLAARQIRAFAEMDRAVAEKIARSQRR